MIKKYLIVSYQADGTRHVHDKLATMDEARASLRVVRQFLTFNPRVTDLAIETEVLTGREQKEHTAQVKKKG